MVSVIDHDDDYMAQMGMKSYGTLNAGKGTEGRQLDEDEKKKEQQRSKRPRLTEDQLVRKDGLPWLVSDMGLRCGPCKKVMVCREAVVVLGGVLEVVIWHCRPCLYQIETVC